MLTSKHLCETLMLRAVWTNDLIRDGYSSQLGVLEETITDVNLIEIHRLHSEYVLTRKFSRREEGSKSGADWLWCIGEPGSWLTLLVQAKIVNPKTGRCRYLNYRRGQQRKLLLDFARKKRFLPIYCVYGHIPNGYSPPTKALPALSKIDSDSWACSWLSPMRIRQLANKSVNKQEELLRYSIPWAFPFCHSPRENADNALGHQVASGFSQAKKEVGDESIAVQISDNDRQTGKSERTSWEDVEPLELVTEDIPRIVQDLATGRVPGSRAPVSSMIITSGVPISQVSERIAAVADQRGTTMYFPHQDIVSARLRSKR